MLYSQSAHAATGAGFFFDDDKRAPSGAIKITDDDFKQAINLPIGSNYSFSVDGVLSFVAPTTAQILAKAKSDAAAKIKAERDRRWYEGGVQVGAYWFQSDIASTTKYNTLLQLSAGLSDTTVLRAGWRTMSGVTVDLTVGLVKQILTAGFASIAATDDASQAHITAMEACADPANYDYSTGWPLIYESVAPA